MATVGKSKSDNGEEIEVEREIVHPKFDETTLENDVMLVKLKEPSSHHFILHLAKEEPRPGKARTILGFGSTNPAEEDPKNFPDKLQKATVSYVSREDCQSAIFFHELTPDMVCAIGEGTDAWYVTLTCKLIRLRAVL